MKKSVALILGVMPGLILGTALAAVTAPVEISQPWARATVAGQSASGAFMGLRSVQAMRITGVHTPVAGVAQIHEMKMDGNRMSMRAVGPLALPAAQLVELKPSGLHIMLMDLKQPLAAGQHFPLTLELQDEKGQKAEQIVDVEVRALAPGAP